MKVLFLDVDGVLNRCGKSGQGLEGDKVKLLQGIVMETGCRIVLSSTWRMFDHGRERIEKMCRDHMGQELYGCTPVHPRLSCGLYRADGRGKEIQDWLTQHPEVERFVIVDDDDDMGGLSHRLVRTYSFEGLTPYIASLVIQKLNQPTPTSFL